MPAYTTVNSGAFHMPTFYSTVDVEGEKFSGHVGRSKKQAELSAAKVAYTTLKERKLVMVFIYCEHWQEVDLTHFIFWVSNVPIFIVQHIVAVPICLSKLESCACLIASNNAHFPGRMCVAH